MIKFTKDLIQRTLKLMNLLLIAGLFELLWARYYLPYARIEFNAYTGVVLYGLYCVLYLMYTRIYDGFLVFASRIYELICGQALSAMIADGIMFLFTWLVMGRFPSIWPMVMMLMAQVSLSTLWSVAAHKLYFVNHIAQRSLFVCDSRSDVEELLSERRFSRMFDVQEVLSADELIARDYAPLEQVATVFVASSASAARNQVVTACVQRKKSIYLMPGPEDILFHGAKQVHMFHSSVMRVSRNEPMLGYDITKRAFDLVMSSLALLLLSPVMLLTALAIKLDDGGPVFYLQERLTRNGRSFYIRKFRSMRVDAEKDGVARLSSGDNDDRITRVGRFIRKVRIDELPQLINILCGDMSIVGPRPERPALTEAYSREVPHFRQRLRVKAGLTGYAQVYGKYNTSPRNKLLMDMVYIEHRSLWEDLQIIFATVKTILMPEATEGVAVGQTTALKEPVPVGAPVEERQAS